MRAIKHFLQHNALLSTCVFFIALISFSIIFMLHQSDHSTQTLAVTQQKIDAYMNNATYTNYNKQGQLSAHISALHTRHYPKNNAAYYDHPRVLMYTKKHLPWYITADHGRSHHGDDHVLLYGHVIVTQPQTSQTILTTISTDKLYVRPELQTAHTSDPVTITRPGSTTSAIGLTANFKTGIFKLLSKAKGHYEQQP